ncbi:thiol reductant ABC exporter subunit CydC [Paenibacillus yanchengensis]|uniref:Thiol reductant ABC exporter subunit CydC n=1 Tax=Paenibacillus yanchengensis TaxID=2035833 RepID=A0ABW4YHW0_9BACL
MNKQSTQERQKGFVLPYIWKFRWQFLLAACLGSIAVLAAAALLFTSGYLISRSSLRPENILMVYVPIVLVRTFGFSKAVFQYLEKLAGHNGALKILSTMRARLYRMVEPIALTMRSRFTSGDLLGLLAEDIERLQNIFLKVILPALTSLIAYGVAIFMLGRFDVTFALLMALYGALWIGIAPLFLFFLSLKRRRAYKQQRSMLYAELTDAIYGMTDWTLSGRSQAFLQRYNQKFAQMASLDNRLRRAEWIWQLVSRSSTALAVIMLAIWAAGMVFDGQMQPTLIAAMALVTMPLMDVFVKVGDAVYEIPDYMDAIERLKKVESNNNTTNSHPTQSEAAHADVLVQSSQAKAAKLSLQQVSFYYEQHVPSVLDNINLTVAAGSKVAVLGKSGAGKSTMLNIMLGELQPITGTVTINDRNVKEYSDLPFAVLNQKPYLFDTTVANNVRLAKPEATDEQVWRVIEMVELAPLIQSLPNGLHTRMEETGARFSGGERQRIALARILLQDKPIILLDEPTVGLDPITEKKLLDTIFTVLQEKTMVWFTHHLAAMEQMDEIIFLQHGKMAMRGSHKQLIQHEEKYRRLYELDHL